MEKKFLIISLLSVILLFLTNFDTKEEILEMSEIIIGLSFILFLSGYLLVKLTLKELGSFETIILSIGISICLSILFSMILHFIGFEITKINIINVLSFTSFLLGLINLVKTDSDKKFEIRDKNMLVLSILTLIIISIIIYISIKTPSEEEFLEIYWRMSIMENLTKPDEDFCALENCSFSGNAKIGDIYLHNESFKALLMDIRTGDEFHDFCLDFNLNGTFCEEGEGVFEKDQTFFIDENGFTTIRLGTNSLVIANYPKETTKDSLEVDFFVKSYYKTPITTNASLFVNDELKDSKILYLYPDIEKMESFTANLPNNGLYRIKVTLMTSNLNRNPYIDFWINKF